jgi:hypothetical protein
MNDYDDDFFKNSIHKLLNKNIIKDNKISFLNHLFDLTECSTPVNVSRGPKRVFD